MQNTPENTTPAETEEQEERGKKRRIFPLLLLLYFLICAGVIFYFMTRLHTILVSYQAAYEQSLPEYYLSDALAPVTEGQTEGLAVTLSDDTTPGNDTFNNIERLQEYIRSRLSDGQYTCPAEPVVRRAGEAVFEIASAGEAFALLTLTEQPGTLPYGFSSWKATSLKILDEAYLPSEIRLHLPSAATAYVNGIPLSSDTVVSDQERITLLDTLIAENLIREETVPTMKTLAVQGVFIDPQVTVTDASGNEIAYRIDENGMYEAAEFPAPDEFIAFVSPQTEGMLEPWGLFFSRDGAYYNIQRYFWPGSPVDRYLPKVDVSWMQYHNRVSFEDKRVENYRLYNENCFSCDVHFSQIIGVGDNPEVRRWDSDMTWIFIRPEGQATWFLADMMTLTGTQNATD